ncbi:hamartin isoform X3 [Dendroctonus ponderosae]|uniref:Hamartin n=1 Tax=Dendroctonus ponderosae TaxID=77166 RepID=A0AAR5PLI4_DENPD|nr:hamartin isoform X3 [Dendroctonus ponderosae]
MSHPDNFFEKLESGNKEVVENIKHSIREQFSKVHESWLINGLYDYYLSSNSVRCMEVIITLREPHQQFLFDRLCESIKSRKTDLKVRIQALTLLGHIARSQPTWLITLPEHVLFRELLNFLKNETELLPLISALLILIVLLPMFPSSIGEHYLEEIFDIFRRLAAWNSNVPGKLGEDQMIHLQVALYALFLRLYGMYPCNFLCYLKSHFKDRNNPVFYHTIKPMMDTVKMHPSLVTTSKESETTTERWKKMGVHDVIVECERFSLDITDRCPHDTCQNTTEFRSRSGTMNSMGGSTSNDAAYHQQNIRSLASLQMSGNEGSFFSPSQMFQVVHPLPMGDAHRQRPALINRVNYPLSQEGSPPEAAIEATPETTPIRGGDGLGGAKPPPSSPLKIINSDQSNRQRLDSPISQEDEEVCTISSSAGRLSVTRKRADFEESAKDGEEVEQGSPCAVGGLHMPNSKSIDNFKKRIRRYRYHSQCNTEPDRVETSTGSSPGNGISFATTNLTVRRANSCPDMKKSPHVPAKGNKSRPFYETDEETLSGDQASTHSNGLDMKAKKMNFPVTSSATQTEVFWPMPYEHLFLNIFPSLKEEAPEMRPSSTPSPAPALHQGMEPYKPSLYDILDKYIENCVATVDSNNALKDQLQLIYQQFLFERHRRETHAYRNRRLLSDAKNTRLLEEYNSALRDQVQLKQKEIDDLRKQLEDYRREMMDEQTTLTSTMHYMEDKCKNLTDENSILRESNRKLESDIVNYKTKCNHVDKERQQAEAVLLDALAEGKVAREQALAGEKLKQELQRVNGELLLMGELHIKYREKLDQLSSKRQTEEELRQLSETYREEVKVLQRVIETKTITIEVFRARINDQEHAASAKDETIANQKRLLAAVNEERESMVEAVESKYQTQLAINRTLEERLLELRQRLELEAARRRTHSPDTSSCHEVQASSTTTTAAGGLSPQHSSPLSASLASSEGSAAMHELRNLQMYVDQESGSKSHPADERTNVGKND